MGVDHGNLYIFQSTHPADQVEALEDEADLLVPHLVQLIRRHGSDVHAVQVVVSERRAVQTAEDIHEGRLSGAGLPHNGDELPTEDL